MSCFLYVNDDDNVGKINIDDLYEKVESEEDEDQEPSVQIHLMSKEGNLYLVFKCNYY